MQFLTRTFAEEDGQWKLVNERLVTAKDRAEALLQAYKSGPQDTKVFIEVSDASRGEKPVSLFEALVRIAYMEPGSVEGDAFATSYACPICEEMIEIAQEALRNFGSEVMANE